MFVEYVDLDLDYFEFRPLSPYPFPLLPTVHASPAMGDFNCDCDGKLYTIIIIMTFTGLEETQKPKPKPKKKKKKKIKDDGTYCAKHRN